MLDIVTDNGKSVTKKVTNKVNKQKSEITMVKPVPVLPTTDMWRKSVTLHLMVHGTMYNIKVHGPAICSSL